MKPTKKEEENKERVIRSKLEKELMKSRIINMAEKNPGFKASILAMGNKEQKNK